MGDYYLWGFGDFDSALDEYAIAREGIPGDSELFRGLANLQRRMGKWDESVANWERAIELDPRNIGHRVQLVRTYDALRNYEQADQTVERALEIAPDIGQLRGARAATRVFRDGDYAFYAGSPNPLTRYRVAVYERDYATALSHLDRWGSDVYTGQPWQYVPKASFYGVTYQLAGKSEMAEQHFEAAREHLKSALEANPKDFRLYNALGTVLTGLGENEEAVRMARQAIDAMSGDTYALPNYQLDAILVFVAAGDSNAAIEELDAYLGAPGDWSIEGLLPDPRLDPIRDDPRFQALVEKYRRR
jgi:tetratricopeptide (TPR) repeat protein